MGYRHRAACRPVHQRHLCTHRHRRVHRHPGQVRHPGPEDGDLHPLSHVLPHVLSSERRAGAGGDELYVHDAVIAVLPQLVQFAQSRIADPDCGADRARTDDVPGLSDGTASGSVSDASCGHRRKEKQRTFQPAVPEICADHRRARAVVAALPADPVRRPASLLGDGIRRTDPPVPDLKAPDSVPCDARPSPYGLRRKDGIQYLGSDLQDRAGRI